METDNDIFDSWKKTICLIGDSIKIGCHWIDYGELTSFEFKKAASSNDRIGHITFLYFGSWMKNYPFSSNLLLVQLNWIKKSIKNVLRLETNGEPTAIEQSWT